MRTLALTLAALMALALPACGGDDGDDGGNGGAAREPGTVTTPAELPEQSEDDATVVQQADFESCVKGEGLQVFPPVEQIPGTDGGRLDVGVSEAEQIAVFWPESEHVADVFVAEGAAGADKTEQELLTFFEGFGATEEQAKQFIQRAGNVIVTPDNDSGPDDAELAQLRGCIG